jgi:hypothetical protein
MQIRQSYEGGSGPGGGIPNGWGNLRGYRSSRNSGAAGPQEPATGLGSAQYVGENAWSESVAGITNKGSTSIPVSSIPAGDTLIITGIEASNLGVSCHLAGKSHGNAVNYYFRQTGTNNQESGLQWPLDSTGAASATCKEGSTVITLTGYLSA